MIIPEFPCRDCKVNTCPLEGDREYYEVRDEVWHAAGAWGFGQSDNGPEGYFLCVGCLEARLGRQLVQADFKSFPANVPSPWLTPRLNSRLGMSPGWSWGKDARFYRVQFYPNALNDAVVERFNPIQHHVSPTGSAAVGVRNK